MPEENRGLSRALSGLKRILALLGLPLILLLLTLQTTRPAVPQLTADQFDLVRSSLGPASMLLFLGIQDGEPGSAEHVADILSKAKRDAEAQPWRQYAADYKEREDRRERLLVVVIAMALAVALRDFLAPRDWAMPVAPEGVLLASLFIFTMWVGGPYQGEWVPIFYSLMHLYALCYLVTAIVKHIRAWHRQRNGKDAARGNGEILFEGAAAVLTALPWLDWYAQLHHAELLGLATLAIGFYTALFPWLILLRHPLYAGFRRQAIIGLCLVLVPLLLYIGAAVL